MTQHINESDGSVDLLEPARGPHHRVGMSKRRKLGTVARNHNREVARVSDPHPHKIAFAVVGVGRMRVELPDHLQARLRGCADDLSEFARADIDTAGCCIGLRKHCVQGCRGRPVGQAHEVDDAFVSPLRALVKMLSDLVTAVCSHTHRER